MFMHRVLSQKKSQVKQKKWEEKTNRDKSDWDYGHAQKDVWTRTVKAEEGR